MTSSLVSIVINNYNHGRFLAAAIDSALNQDHPHFEVVVVDDGSSDESRRIIAGYQGRIVPILKKNGGQASAFNAGVAASHGEILCFLDSDDLFDPRKVSRIVAYFRGRGLCAEPVMVHHLLRLRDEAVPDHDHDLFGRTHLSPLNLYSFAKRHRFLWFTGGPTTAISLSRALADRLFPLPETNNRISADDFVVRAAFLIGQVHSLAEPLGVYRVHGGNNHYGLAPKKSLEFMTALEEYLNSKLVENGLAPVISFDDSLCAWPTLRDERRWGRLLWDMARICARDRDSYTLSFAGGVLADMGRRVLDKATRSAGTPSRQPNPQHFVQ
jgi:glycosyltransferase involved in cell wall biosynthesis